MPHPHPAPEPGAIAPTPPAPESGGSLRPALAGAALALPFAAALYLLRDGALDLLALILAASGGVYWGVAVSGQPRRTAAVEALAGLAFVAIAMLGLWWSSLWIAGGYVLHALWDFAHHPRGIRTGIRRWFPPFCATFDFLVAALILVFR
jgi:hypothetical protein